MSAECGHAGAEHIAGDGADYATDADSAFAGGKADDGETSGTIQVKKRTQVVFAGEAEPPAFILVRCCGVAKVRVSRETQADLCPLRGLALLGHLSKEFLGALLHLGGAQVFFMCADAPNIAERIGESAVTVAPELVGHGHGLLCTGGDGLPESLINVRDVDVERAGAAAQCLR